MKRRSRRRLSPVYLLLALLLAALGRWGAPEFFSFRPASPRSESSPRTASGDWRTIVRVVDGDTLVLDGNDKIRLIGVNTPESVDPRRPVEYFGKEASAFTRRMAEGRRARLEFGPESRDRYGRSLAYVFLDDGTHLNAEIIRQGYSQAYTRFPHPRLEEFRAYEREARQNGRGLWAESASAPR